MSRRLYVAALALSAAATAALIVSVITLTRLIAGELPTLSGALIPGVGEAFAFSALLLPRFAKSHAQSRGR